MQESQEAHFSALGQEVPFRFHPSALAHFLDLSQQLVLVLILVLVQE